ncbi:MAG: TetR/AcrR family transcriptional regulator [Verrucomicrobiae bacterium]|nr:TetR/AcrR family transcriptional regulator [Verrucomicrobiae bacterium]
MQKKPDDARMAVLNSAIEAFARKGYAGTSITDILEATGLSKPTLYYHFESKAGLFQAILDFAFDEPYTLMVAAAADARGTEAKLAAIAAVLFEFCGTHQHLTRLALSASFAAEGEIPPASVNPAKRRRNFEFVLSLIREGQRTQVLDPQRDPTEMAHGIFGSITSQIRMHFLTPAGPLDRERAERVVSLFLNGARAPR